MQKRQYRPYPVKQMSWLYRPSGSLEDELYEKHNTLAFLFEVPRGNPKLFKPSTWFDTFRWYNPQNIQTCLKNNIRAALYLLEIADNPKKAS